MKCVFQDRAAAAHGSECESALWGLAYSASGAVADDGQS